MLAINEKLYPGDLVQMRKPHPCGGDSWEIVRVGADVGLLCETCGRRVLLTRRKFARGVRKFLRRSPQALKNSESPD